MNSNETASEHSTPRWAAEAAEAQPSGPERAVLMEVLGALRRIRHGSVQLSIQDGKVVQIDMTEKRRM